MDEHILDSEQLEQAPVVYATFWQRVGASLIDGLVMIPVVVILFLNITSIKSLAIAILLNAVYLIYKIWMEGTSGATIGKRAMHIYVVTDQLQPINITQAATRSCFYILNSAASMISAIIVFNAAGFSDVNSFMEYSQFQQEHNFAIDNLLSLLTLVSILFVAWDKQKQALHDKIAKTYVIHR